MRWRHPWRLAAGTSRYVGTAGAPATTCTGPLFPRSPLCVHAAVGAGRCQETECAAAGAHGARAARYGPARAAVQGEGRGPSRQPQPRVAIAAPQPQFSQHAVIHRFVALQTPPVDVSDLRPSQLTNAGVLVASLRSHAPPVAASSGAADAAAAAAAAVGGGGAMGAVSVPAAAAAPVVAAGAAATPTTAGSAAGDSGDAADAADGSVEVGSVQLVVQAIQRGEGVVRGILNPWDDGTGTA